MALQTFTASQVLTATQMNNLQANDYNWTVSNKTGSYVLVAADKGTTIVMNSASATTITVNTSLFAAGDTLRIQNIGAGACVVTAGTATVTSAGSLSVPQWGGGTLYFTSASAAVYFPNAISTTSGSTLISRTSFSASATWNLDNVFTSTYDNYRMDIVWTALVASVSYAGITLRTGGTASVTGYQYANAETNSASVVARYSTTATSMPILESDSANAALAGATLTIMKPNLAQATSFLGQYIGVATGLRGVATQGLHNVATSYDGFGLTFGTNATGTVYLYGLAR